MNKSIVLSLLMFACGTQMQAATPMLADLLPSKDILIVASKNSFSAAAHALSALGTKAVASVRLGAQESFNELKKIDYKPVYAALAAYAVVVGVVYAYTAYQHSERISRCYRWYHPIRDINGTEYTFDLNGLVFTGYDHKAHKWVSTKSIELKGGLTLGVTRVAINPTELKIEATITLTDRCYQHLAEMHVYTDADGHRFVKESERERINAVVKLYKDLNEAWYAA